MFSKGTEMESLIRIMPYAGMMSNYFIIFQQIIACFLPIKKFKQLIYGLYELISYNIEQS